MGFFFQALGSHALRSKLTSSWLQARMLASLSSGLSLTVSNRKRININDMLNYVYMNFEKSRIPVISTQFLCSTISAHNFFKATVKQPHVFSITYNLEAHRFGVTCIPLQYPQHN